MLDNVMVFEMTGGVVEMTGRTVETVVSFVISGIMAKNVCWKCSFSLYFVYDIDKKVKPF